MNRAEGPGREEEVPHPTKHNNNDIRVGYFKGAMDCAFSTGR